MNRIYTLFFSLFSIISSAQNKDVKPIILFGELGGSHLGLSAKINRIYKVKPKIAFTYELGVSPFKRDDLSVLNPTFSVGWSSLIFSKNNNHFEVGMTTSFDKSAEPIFLMLAAYRFQNLDSSRTFVRIGVMPFKADGSGFSFTTFPVLSIGYAIK